MSSTTPTASGDRDPEGTTNTRLRVVSTRTSDRGNLKSFRSESAADMGAVKRLLFLAAAIVAVAGGVHIDQELMLPAIDRTMRVENGVAEVVAFLFAGIAALCAWNAGKALREAWVYGWGNPPLWVNLAGFLLIGATFFGMRVIAGSSRVASSAEADPRGMAFLLLASYLAVGLLAASEAYYLVNPALSAKIRAQSMLDRLAPAVRAAEAKVTETIAALQVATYRQEAVHHEYQEALEATHDVAAGARDYARLLIAASLGNPAQTGLVFDRYPGDAAALAPKTDPIGNITGDVTNNEEN